MKIRKSAQTFNCTFKKTAASVETSCTQAPRPRPSPRWAAARGEVSPGGACVQPKGNSKVISLPLTTLLATARVQRCKAGAGLLLLWNLGKETIYPKRGQ